MRQRGGVVGREMTEEDWKALYLVHELARQVVLFGSSALLPFAQAVVAEPGMITGLVVGEFIEAGDTVSVAMDGRVHRWRR